LSIWERPSISKLLPLGVVGLFTLALATMVVMAYVEVRSSAIAIAAHRLGGQAQQLASLLGTSAEQRQTVIREFANMPALASFLASSVDTVPAPIADSLHAFATRQGSSTSIELWDADGTVVARSGTLMPAMAAGAATALIESIPSTGSAIGPLAGTDSVTYAVIARIGQAPNPLGYVLERRPLTTTPAAVRQLRGLMGEARIVIGSHDGAWSDLTTVVPAPPTKEPLGTDILQYTRVPGEPVIAHSTRISGTPWTVIAELPRQPVLSAARQFSTRAGSLALVLILIGGMVAWSMGRRIALPLQQLTVAAESIAAGNVASRVTVSGLDEVGRLATSFNTMAGRIEAMKQDLVRLVEHYRPLFERNPLPMWLGDPDSGRILEVNDAAVAHYGRPRVEFLTMSLDDFAVGRVPVGHGEGDDSDATTLERHRRGDGEVIDVEVTRHTIEETGRAVSLILANDVTSRLAAERALRDFNAELEKRVAERTAELASTNRELEAFSYSVSHDLRAPLRAINGFSRMLAEDHADDLSVEAQAMLDVISASATKMGHLIDDLLGFSRLARQPLSQVRIDMTALARSIAAEVRAALPDRSIELIVDELPPAHGEPGLIRQALTNLIQNAVKFSEERSPARIVVSQREEAGGQTEYFVRDNGVGFDMRYADKLFGVFQRLHRDDEFEGTGVGLAIVQRIVHRHGGRIRAESEVGKGATFYFTIPGRNPDA